MTMAKARGTIALQAGSKRDASFLSRANAKLARRQEVGATSPNLDHLALVRLLKNVAVQRAVARTLELHMNTPMASCR